MAKSAKRLNLDTTTSIVVPVFDPNVPDINTIREFRDFYMTVGQNEDDTPLTTQRGDLELWNWYAVIRQQYPTLTTKGWYELLAKQTFDTDNPVTQTELPTNMKLSKPAQAVVDRLNKDETFGKIASDAVAAKTILQAVELQFMVCLLTDFAAIGNTPWQLGQRGTFVCPMLDALPEPGSKEPSKKERKEGKHGYDGRGNALNAKPATGYDLAWQHINAKDVLVSCYREMACTFPEGVRIVADINACDEALKSNTGPYKGNSKEYIDGHQKRLKGHLSDLVGWLRFAVSVIRQMQAVNTMSKLHCYLITSEQSVATDDGVQTVIQIVPGTIVMWVEERRDGGNRQGHNLTDFMKWRPTVAEEKGGTLGELSTSEQPAEQREPSSGQGNVTAKIEAVTAINVAFVAEAFAKYVHDSIITVQRTLNDPDHTKSDALLFALANIRIDLDAMFASHPDYVKRADDGLEHGGKFLAEYGMGAATPAIVDKMKAAGNKLVA